jgi:hypothetical protein
MLRRFWRNESGSASPEWAFLVTILVLGAITGIIASKPLDPPPPAEDAAVVARQ